jgi:ADP-ribose pyrophosphatase YjhB (NUDIX family)/phosphohistidine phosphatase SixA
MTHRPKYDDWSFPKGKADPGESDEDCALREVQEETGLRCRLGRELATASYIDRKGRHKTVRYWAMEPEEGEFVPNDEVDRAEWATLRSALERLSYDHDVAIVEELLRQDVNQAAILLVRHGTAGKREKWEGDDRLRPLDALGRRQAAELVDMLSDYPVKRILSSPYARCIQSVEPLGKRLGLEVETVDELAEGATAEDVRRLMESVRGELAVFCTHGDVVETVLGSKVPNKKGGVWILGEEDGSFVPIRYLLPPSVD